MMKPRIILDQTQLRLTIDRLCHQLMENHGDFSRTCIIGVQPRGIYLSDRLVSRLREKMKKAEILYGKLDVSFYRDDFRHREKLISPHDTTIDFSVENRKVVLVDDVLYTGRTIRAALDALLDFGRPECVELLVLIDRRLSRHVPVEANYIGRQVDAVRHEYIKVNCKETTGKDAIWILPEKD